MPSGEARLHIVADRQGQKMSVGTIQADWLRDQGLIDLVEFRQTTPASGVNLYNSTGPSVHELNERVMAEPTMRECDFCRALPSGWRINIRSPIQLTQGPTPGPINRPVFACETCAGLVRDNAKEALITRAIDLTVEYAKGQGGALAAHTATLTPHQIRQGLMPLVREIVTQTFANREGSPERDG